MTSRALEPQAGEPLSLLASPVSGTGSASFSGARAERLEFSCRGDRVPCTLLVPSGEGTFPLVLLQHESRSPAGSARLEDVLPWVEAGCALASIDLPLQRSRRSAKLSELLEGTIAHALEGREIEPTATQLWCEFARQATLELRRTLDLVAGLPSIDAERIGFAGQGLGALVGALLCGVDSRPTAVVLADAGGGFAPAAIDPGRWVGRIAPRPLLLLNEDANAPARRSVPDEIPKRIPKELALNLRAAAGEPTETAFPTDPEAALDATWRFLSVHLGL